MVCWLLDLFRFHRRRGKDPDRHYVRDRRRPRPRITPARIAAWRAARFREHAQAELKLVIDRLAIERRPAVARRLRNRGARLAALSIS